MSWSRVDPSTRALAALAVALAAFVPVFLLAPADDGRVVVVAALAGALVAAVSWQHFPGWDLFAAGCAFTVAGRFHSVLPSGWFLQAMLLLPGVVCWYLGARLTELWLVFPLGYGDPFVWGRWRRLREELVRGGTVTAVLALAAWILLSGLLGAAEPLAFPLAAGLSLAAGLRWPVRRPLWPVLGLLAALPLAGPGNRLVATLLGVPPPTPVDPWLLGGMLILGGMVGLWLSRWRRGEPRGPRGEDPRRVAPGRSADPAKDLQHHRPHVR